ncbi:MAG TPA: hypothetical protein VF069_28375 [Streptosporangiaceae bacterium]
MASHHLSHDDPAGYLAGYLDRLARGLPADAVDELADGLTETWRHHIDAGRDPAAAARAATAEFGTPETIIAAFVAHAPGRRIARALLVSGPALGACWGASLITAHAWTWPIPVPAAAGYAVTLLAVAAALLLAATGRRSLRRTRLGAIGGIGIVALDAAMLATTMLVAPVLVWPMAVAIPASLARITLTVRSLPAALAP